MLSDDELLAADGSARQDALDVSRSFIVQAPAGSGKTELLIQRYLKLLTIVDCPEEVLAITFTRKAALEMQLRVINALRQARDGVEADQEHERFTIATAKDVLSRDDELGWRLLGSPARMRIETVDAFGAGIAKSLPLSSGLGGAGMTIADAEMDSIYRSAAVATLDHLPSDDAAGQSVERVLVHLDNNIGLYVRYVASMLASREQWLSITGSGLSGSQDTEAARRKLEANIADVIEKHLAMLRSLMPDRCREELPGLLWYAAGNLRESGKTDHLLVELDGTTDVPGASVDDRGTWQAIADLLLTKEGSWRKSARSFNKNHGFPPGDAGQKQQLADLIETLHQCYELHDFLHRSRTLPEPHYSDEQWEVLLALFELLPLAVAELRRIFGERGVTDHNEVALSASRALGSSDEPGDIALMLDYQIRHLLIDEMQDTSIGQYDLLRKLTAGWTPGDGRTVFCVGDPMQSIYRFRDAEVGEFLLARQNGIGDVSLESLLLRRNFRSGENLVHWFNTVFLQIMPIRDDISVGAISYSESVPVEQHAGSGEHHIHPLFDASPEEEAACGLDVISNCLAKDPEENVAVLVRSRTQLPALLQELRLAGIEYQAVEIDRLTDLPEIIDLLALTRALCHEGDRLAWLAMLRGPWAGLGWQDLHLLVRNDTAGTLPELCADPDRLAGLSEDGMSRLRAFLKAVAPFMKRHAGGSLRHRIERAWFALGGPSCVRDNEQLENVYRYFDALEKIESSGTLEDVRDLEQRLDDERVSSTVSSDCRVQIMTMHKAKGLQFDHIVLYGLGRVTRGSDRSVLSWLNIPGEAGENEMIISPVGARAELEHDPLHQFIEATEKDKTRMELDRLLYVACTRAKKSLQLIGHVGVSPDRESYKSPDSRSLLHRLWPAIEQEFARGFDAWLEASGDRAGDVGRERLVQPVLRRLGDGWQLPSPPELAGSEGRPEPVAEDAEKQVEFYWVGSAARHAGTIVHRWLQRISDGRVDVDGDGLAGLRATSRRWASGLGVAEDQADEVCERVESALSGILADEKGRWVLHGDGEAVLPVTGVMDGRVESIVIDRVRVDEDGTHWIVDYKTSTHEGGDLEGFLRQEADRYRPQLTKYATLYANLTGAEVRIALYFPLLQEFREVVL